MPALLPTLTSPRLTLRPFTEMEAPEVKHLAGSKQVAEMIPLIPHPYPLEAAITWISSLATQFEEQRTFTLAVTSSHNGDLLGAMTLHLALEHHRAEIGYWFGIDHWGKGYCTEAAQTMVDYARKHFGLTRIIGRCLAKNTGSARVLEKLGMQPEGRLVAHEYKDGIYQDLLLFGLSDRNN